MVLDPHNLSVCLKLSFLDLPKMANGNGKWQIWQCIVWTFFDAQMPYGGLKASEFNHKLDHGDQNYLRHCLGCQKNLLQVQIFLPCILEGRGVPKRRLVYLALRDLFLVSEHFYDINDTHSSCLA